jgi:hypothetical protein
MNCQLVFSNVLLELAQGDLEVQVHYLYLEFQDLDHHQVTHYQILRPPKNQGLLQCLMCEAVNALVITSNF